jgi:excisionase family DNA binding protein
MPNLRISEAASLLGVSDDTVRRWVEQGRLDAVQEHGRMAVEGRKLAAFA